MSSPIKLLIKGAPHDARDAQTQPVEERPHIQVTKEHSMARTHRKLAFVLAATDHGTMIVNRFDRHMVGPNEGFGVGFQLLENASFDPAEIELALNLLDLRRRYFGDGVFAIDCGANIGVHAVEWAKRMTGWGSVIAFEAQERIYYALAGNIAINNCFNARAVHAAVGAQKGTMKIPSPDYLKPASFGSLELRRRGTTEFIGQAIDYSEASLVEVLTASIDSLLIPRIDMIKIDVEGMELEVLEGAAKSIADQRPILLVESIKTDKLKLGSWLTSFDYLIFETGLNFLAVHKTDQSLKHIGKTSP
jgi:FkbM family methyltransferase